MKALTFDRIAVNVWVSSRLRRDGPWESGYQAFGVTSNGRIVAGVVFDCVAVGERCGLHCAGEGKHWLTREFLRAVFDYAFNVCQVRVIISPVDSDNAACRRFIEHVGFRPEHVILEGAGDVDLVLYTMRRPECRWLN